MILIISTSSFASIEQVEKIYYSRGTKLNKTRSMVIELANSGLYFSAISWMKEYLILNNRALDSQIEEAFEKIITRVGVKQFESLPEKYLKNSKSSSVRYILGKKYLKDGKFKDGLGIVADINPNHPIYPFGLNLKSALYANLNQKQEALNAFKDCERASLARMNRITDPLEKKQLSMNHNYCVAGVARANFAASDYKEANLKYLDIMKSWYIWPEILIEEAWTSYYLRDYNRTLGKLVTYKAPVLDFIFKPEIEVLKALTYLKMCLYDDAKIISDKFYTDYMQPTRDLRTYLLNNKKNYKYYYRLMLDFEQTEKANSSLEKSILKGIRKESGYEEVKQGILNAYQELQTLKNLNSNRRILVILDKGLQDIIQRQKDMLGAYVRKSLVSNYAELYRAFEGMSYIKLEVLAQKKEALYKALSNDGKKRGDFKYIEKNDKQYFWDFNGEFWADEIGDYVFALKSEC